MKTTTLAVVGLLLLVAPASAHGVGGGFGLFGDFGGLGFGGWGFGDHHAGFDGFGGFGGDFGLGFFNADRVQERFENRFDSLKTQYDEGVAGSGDFFTTDEYGRIVDKTELLDDRYGLFVSGVERSIDRLGDVISIANDDVTYFSDLLAKYQADDSLSAARLERIEMWINRVTDRLNTKIDSLTDKQTTLQTNLPTYQSFQTDLSTFLTDIVAAGGGTSGGASLSLKSLAGMSSSLLAAAGSGTAECAATSVTLTPEGVPEPSAAMLVLLAGGGISMGCGRRGRRAAR